MGNESSISSSLSEEDVEKYSKITRFTPSEVISLSKKLAEFKNSKLSHGIKEDEFLSLMGMTNKGVGHIMFKMLDSDQTGNINFDKFIRGLDVFLPSTPKELKAEKCFQAYDSKNLGLVTKNDICEIIEMSLHNTIIRMNKAQIKQLVNDLFRKYAFSNPSSLTKAEFIKMAIDVPAIIDLVKYDIKPLLESGINIENYDADIN